MYGEDENCGPCEVSLSPPAGELSGQLLRSPGYHHDEDEHDSEHYHEDDDHDEDEHEDGRGSLGWFLFGWSDLLIYLHDDHDHEDEDEDIPSRLSATASCPGS